MLRGMGVASVTVILKALIVSVGSVSISVTAVISRRPLRLASPVRSLHYFGLLYDTINMIRGLVSILFKVPRFCDM